MNSDQGTGRKRDKLFSPRLPVSVVLSSITSLPATRLLFLSCFVMGQDRSFFIRDKDRNIYFTLCEICTKAYFKRTMFGDFMINEC